MRPQIRPDLTSRRHAGAEVIWVGEVKRGSRDAIVGFEHGLTTSQPNNLVHATLP